MQHDRASAENTDLDDAVVQRVWVQRVLDVALSYDPQVSDHLRQYTQRNQSNVVTHSAPYSAHKSCASSGVNLVQVGSVIGDITKHSRKAPRGSNQVLCFSLHQSSKVTKSRAQHMFSNQPTILCVGRKCGTFAMKD